MMKKTGEAETEKEIEIEVEIEAEIERVDIKGIPNQELILILVPILIDIDPAQDPIIEKEAKIPGKK